MKKCHYRHLYKNSHNFDALPQLVRICQKYELSAFLEKTANILGVTPTS